MPRRSKRPGKRRVESAPDVKTPGPPAGSRSSDAGRSRDSPRARPESAGLAAAFDAIQFSRERILNLRESLPTGAEAARRTDAWLRERQAAKAGEVLVITGRGRGSLDGVPVVRDAIIRLFTGLRRSGVILDAREHTAGSFVVRLAPLQALVDAPRRRHRTPLVATPDPIGLRELDLDTRVLIRRLAAAALGALGMREPSETFIADEMVRQFTTLAATVPLGPDREASLRARLARALEEYE